MVIRNIIDLITEDKSDKLSRLEKLVFESAPFREGFLTKIFAPIFALNYIPHEDGETKDPDLENKYLEMYIIKGPELHEFLDKSHPDTIARTERNIRNMSIFVNHAQRAKYHAQFNTDMIAIYNFLNTNLPDSISQADSARRFGRQQAMGTYELHMGKLGFPSSQKGEKPVSFKDFYKVTRALLARRFPGAKEMYMEAQMTNLKMGVKDFLWSLGTFGAMGAAFTLNPLLGLTVTGLTNPVLSPFGNGAALNPIVALLDKIIPDNTPLIGAWTSKRFKVRFDTPRNHEKKWAKLGVKYGITDLAAYPTSLTNDVNMRMNAGTPNGPDNFADTSVPGITGRTPSMALVQGADYLDQIARGAANSVAHQYDKVMREASGSLELKAASISVEDFKKNLDATHLLKPLLDSFLFLHIHAKVDPVTGGPVYTDMINMSASVLALVDTTCPNETMRRDLIKWGQKGEIKRYEDGASDQNKVLIDAFSKQTEFGRNLEAQTAKKLALTIPGISSEERTEFVHMGVTRVDFLEDNIINVLKANKKIVMQDIISEMNLNPSGKDLAKKLAGKMNGEESQPLGIDILKIATNTGKSAAQRTDELRKLAGQHYFKSDDVKKILDVINESNLFEKRGGGFVTKQLNGSQINSLAIRINNSIDNLNLDNDAVKQILGNIENSHDHLIATAESKLNKTITIAPQDFLTVFFELREVDKQIKAQANKFLSHDFGIQLKDKIDKGELVLSVEGGIPEVKIHNPLEEFKYYYGEFQRMLSESNGTYQIPDITKILREKNEDGSNKYGPHVDDIITILGRYDVENSIYRKALNVYFKDTESKDISATDDRIVNEDKNLQQGFAKDLKAHRYAHVLNDNYLAGYVPVERRYQGFKQKYSEIEQISVSQSIINKIVGGRK